MRSWPSFMNTWLVAKGSLSNCGAAAAMRAASRLARSALRRHDTAFEIGEKLHRGVPPFAEQLPGALAAELEVGHPGRIEEHHGFSIHAAILDDAKRQHVDARLPGEIRRGDILRHERIRKTRAVHVDRHVPLVSDLRRARGSRPACR